MLLFAVPATIAVVLGLLAARAAARHSPGATIRTIHREAPAVTATAAAAVLVIGALVAVQAYDPLGGRMPLALQVWAPDLTWIAILWTVSFLCAFLAGFGFLSRAPRRMALLPVLVVLNVAFACLVWRGHRPLAGDLSAALAADGHVPQTTPASCAPAAVATVASLHGASMSEQDAARLMRSTTSGTTPGQMRYALARLGFSPRMVRQKRPDIANVNPPAILFVDHPSVGPGPHTVVYVGRRGTELDLWDPLLGSRLLKAAEANAIWAGRGIECGLAPRP